MTVTRSTYAIRIGGKNVTSAFAPILLDLTVTDKAGTHSDTASIKVDDTDGRVRMPRVGDPVVILLAYTTEGMGRVFEGTVDETRADGSRSSGRTVTITAKGLDTTKKAKEPQRRHFDDQDVQSVLDAAGSECGITVECRDGLGALKRKYLDMRDESFVHLGERIAREVGGNFKIKGNRATLTKRNAGLSGSIAATWGDNLHSYSISPKLGRPQFNKTKARWYDKAKAAWQEKEKATDAEDGNATYVNRFISSDEPEADQRTDSDKATTERDKGDGSVTIELDPTAQPDGLCIVAVGKPGVDGAYRIETVTHRLSRSSGGVTSLQLKHPQAE